MLARRVVALRKEQGKVKIENPPSKINRTLFQWLEEMGVIEDGEEVHYKGRHGEVLKRGKLCVASCRIVCDCCGKDMGMSDFDEHSLGMRSPAKRIFVRDHLSIADCRAIASTMESFIKSVDPLTLKRIARSAQPEEEVEDEKVQPNNEKVKQEANGAEAAEAADEEESEDDSFPVEACALNEDLLNDVPFQFPEAVDPADKNDAFCKICGNGGHLICCDGCPAVFHEACLYMTAPPPEQWFCDQCSCSACGQRGLPPEQEMDGLERLDICAVCRISFHARCVEPQEKDSLFYCSSSCRNIWRGLCEILGDDRPVDIPGFQEYKWSLTNINCSLEDLDESLRLLKMSFNPVVDDIAGIDYLENMVKCRDSKFKKFAFSDSYTVVLRRAQRRSSKIVCVALLRVHGSKLAELPFIATHVQYRNQGLCRVVMEKIQDLLRSWNIERLSLLSAENTMNMWMDKFGFQPSPNLQEEFKCFNLVTLEGASLFEKSLQQQQQQQKTPSKRQAPPPESGTAGSSKRRRCINATGQ